VGLTRERTTVNAYCTCPYFEDVDLCKHIWAVVLAAEQSGYLGKLNDGSALTLESDQEFLADMQEGSAFDEEMPFDDDDASYSAHDPPAPRLHSAPRKRRPAAARPANWRKELSRLRQQDGPMSAEFRRPDWPESRQIVYIVDVGFSKQHQALTVEVAGRTRKRDGQWGGPKAQRVPYGVIPILSDADDRDILA